MQLVRFSANAPGGERWRRGTHLLAGATPATVVAASIALFGVYQYARPDPPPDFRAGRTLVIRDVSGSMGGNPRLAPLLARLDSVGLPRDAHVQCLGGGVSASSTGGNLLLALESQLFVNNAPQVVVISDFRLDTPGWDDNDSDGFERLRALLRQVSSKQLYVISLGGAVSEELVEITQSTGGAAMEDWP